MTFLSLLDCLLFIQWFLAVVVQIAPMRRSHLRYYNEEKKKQSNWLFRLPWQAIMVGYIVCYGSLIFGIFLYYKWLPDGIASDWQSILLLISIWCVLLLDKIWNVTFFEYKQRRLTFMITAIMILLCVPMIVALSFAVVWFVPLILVIPFTCFILYTLAFTWSWLPTQATAK